MDRVVLALISLVAVACCQIGTNNYKVEDGAIAQLEHDGAGVCTTFHVGDGFWVTARHCVALTDTEVTIHGVPATLVTGSATADLAVYIGPQQHTKLRLGTLPAFGTPVHYIGYPWFGQDYHHGVYTGFWAEPTAEGEYEFTAPAHGGASGSPVMTEDSKVVGVLVAGYLGQHYTYAVPVTELRKLLEAVQ